MHPRGLQEAGHSRVAGEGSAQAPQCHWASCSSVLLNAPSLLPPSVSSSFSFSLETLPWARAHHSWRESSHYAVLGPGGGCLPCRAPLLPSSSSSCCAGHSGHVLLAGQSPGAVRRLPPGGWPAALLRTPGPAPALPPPPAGASSSASSSSCAVLRLPPRGATPRVPPSPAPAALPSTSFSSFWKSSGGLFWPGAAGTKGTQGPRWPEAGWLRWRGGSVALVSLGVGGWCLMVTRSGG